MIENYNSTHKNRDRRPLILCLGILLVLVIVFIAITVIQGKGVGNKHKGSDIAGVNETLVNNQDNEYSSAKDKQTEVSSLADTTAPVITGVKDRTYNIGDKVMYSSGISAKDDVDGDVEVKVDKSQVNVNKAGSYKVIYTATDKAGNVAAAEAVFTFNVVLVEGASYKQLAAQLLNQIVDSSMSDGQKVKKIYDYLWDRLPYGERRIAGSTWQEESVVALREILTDGRSKGDCFTSAAVAMAVLEAMGAQVKWMQNKGPEVCGANHVWVLCNIGTGWYHFDITHYAKGGKRFMFTDAQLVEWMKQTGLNRYIRDESQYPASATEKFTF